MGDSRNVGCRNKRLSKSRKTEDSDSALELSTWHASNDYVLVASQDFKAINFASYGGREQGRSSGWTLEPGGAS